MSKETEATFPRLILDTITKVTGARGKNLHSPSFGHLEIENVTKCIESTYVSSVGEFVDQFERDLASYTGAKFAVSTVSGTAALHLALIAAGVIQGDEVLVPALTFVATPNAIHYCGAIPHFIDSEETTFGIDVEKLKSYLQGIIVTRNGSSVNKHTGRIIRAVIPMHTFGHPCKMDDLMELAHQFNLKVIEDAAESLGSIYNGKHTGTIGVAGIISFNGNKTITTGGGGAILTNDPKLARTAKHLSTTAKIPHNWEFDHDEIGFNYRMPNLNAALGCAQLEGLEGKLELKRKLFNRYKAAFENVPGVTIISEPKKCRSNYWLQTLLLAEEYKEHRDAILEITNRNGVATRPVWKLIPELTPYKNSVCMDLTTAKSLRSRIVNLPSSPFLGEES